MSGPDLIQYQRTRAALAKRIEATEALKLQRLLLKKQKEQDTIDRQCQRARQARSPTRHIVRFKDPLLNIIRSAIQADRYAPLTDVLALLALTHSPLELASVTEALRYPHELDFELQRRIGFAFNCWGSLAVVTLPDSKLVAVRKRA